MKTTISLSAPTQLETESLVAIVLDHSEKDSTQKEKSSAAKPQLKLATSDTAVQSVATDLLAGGALTGRAVENNLLHKPAGLKAKRLLLISGGATTKISSHEPLRFAWAPSRPHKVRSIHS